MEDIFTHNRIRRQPRHWPKSSVAIALGLAAAVGAISSGKSQPFDAAGAGLTLENTIPDLDLYQLTQFVGLFPGSTLNYGGTIRSGGFTAFISGSYAGQNLSVNYTGDLSAFPGGAVTWTSIGAYGGSAWSGSGAALFSFPTAATFTETYSSSLAVGAHTGTASLVIGGDGSPDIEYSDASGTISTDGAPKNAYPTIKDPDNPQPDELTSDDVCIGMLKGKKCIGTEIIESADVVLSVSPIVDAGTIAVVPEPTTLALLSMSLLSLGLLSAAARCSNP